ncbi:MULTISPECIES: ANR family transcriptional regulator [Vibrio]|jgi:hypothetical protein|uniref:ANR family transcriptional regulator n=1 Tax=Vibrio TaxID=662 RepID=UPI000D35DDF0|nr:MULTISPECIES: ANR family transcriptional regulator [Vibrio]PTP90113.1 hypothetical protein CWO03_05120 [Vibrio splendidus]
MFATTIQKEKSEYPKHAEHAASLERVGSFIEATFAWAVATQHARKPENRHWAQSRSDFCDAWASRYQQGKAA